MPDTFRSLTPAEQALLDQVALGLQPAERLPGERSVTYLDEEGTPVARRDGDTVTLLQPPRWPAPDGSLGKVVVATPGVLPESEMPTAALVLPLGGVRPDDFRSLTWAAAWRAAATAAGAVIVPAPVPPAALADEAEITRLAAAYGDGTVAHVATRPQPPAGGRTVLLSGLSGSGKSTIARALVERIAATRSVTLLDGDVVRTHLSRGLGFSREDRDINIRRIGWVAAEITKHGGLAVCAPIAPYDETRRWVRSTVDAAGGPGSFRLVWVSTPLEVCEQRDVKGLYAKARRGELTGMTGIDDPYEPPTDADLVVDTSAVALDEAVEQVLALI